MPNPQLLLHATGASSGASGGEAPAGSVAPPEKRQGACGRGGRGGRGRGGLSRELQGRGSGVSGGGAAGGGGAPRQQHQHQHSASQQGPDGLRQPGGGSRQRGEGAGGGSARHAGESGAGGGGTGSAGVLGTSPGRRGYLAANHLLGFQSRREGEPGGRGGGGRGGAGGRGGRHGGRAPPRRPAPKPQPYDRNKFLQVRAHVWEDWWPVSGAGGRWTCCNESRASGLPASHREGLLALQSLAPKIRENLQANFRFLSSHVAAFPTGLSLIALCLSWLQANFRFLVSDAVDARRFEADPDRMLEWEDVVQVSCVCGDVVQGRCGAVRVWCRSESGQDVVQ